MIISLTGAQTKGANNEKIKTHGQTTSASEQQTSDMSGLTDYTAV